MLPWGDGAAVLLAAMGLWCAAAAAALARAAQPRAWPALVGRSGSGSTVATIAGVLVFGTVFCVGALHKLDPLALALGGLVIAAVLAVRAAGPAPRLARPWGAAVDVVVVLLVGWRCPTW